MAQTLREQFIRSAAAALGSFMVLSAAQGPAEAKAARAADEKPPMLDVTNLGKINLDLQKPAVTATPASPTNPVRVARTDTPAPVPAAQSAASPVVWAASEPIVAGLGAIGVPLMRRRRNKKTADAAPVPNIVVIGDVATGQMTFGPLVAEKGDLVVAKQNGHNVALNTKELGEKGLFRIIPFDARTNPPPDGMLSNETEILLSIAKAEAPSLESPEIEALLAAADQANAPAPAAKSDPVAAAPDAKNTPANPRRLVIVGNFQGQRTLGVLVKMTSNGRDTESYFDNDTAVYRDPQGQERSLNITKLRAQSNFWTTPETAQDQPAFDGKLSPEVEALLKEGLEKAAADAAIADSTPEPVADRIDSLDPLSREAALTGAMRRNPKTGIPDTALAASTLSIDPADAPPHIRKKGSVPRVKGATAPNPGAPTPDAGAVNPPLPVMTAEPDPSDAAANDDASVANTKAAATAPGRKPKSIGTTIKKLYTIAKLMLQRKRSKPNLADILDLDAELPASSPDLVPTDAKVVTVDAPINVHELANQINAAAWNISPEAPTQPSAEPVQAVQTSIIQPLPPVTELVKRFAKKGDTLVILDRDGNLIENLGMVVADYRKNDRTIRVAFSRIVKSESGQDPAPASNVQNYDVEFLWNLAVLNKLPIVALPPEMLKQLQISQRRGSADTGWKNGHWADLKIAQQIGTRTRHLPKAAIKVMAIPPLIPHTDVAVDTEALFGNDYWAQTINGTLVEKIPPAAPVIVADAPSSTVKAQVVQSIADLPEDATGLPSNWKRHDVSRPKRPTGRRVRAEVAQNIIG